LNFNLYNSILFAGILQGFIFAFIVFINKKYKNKTNLFLVALLVCFSLNNIQYYILDTEIITETPFYNYIYTPWCLIIPVFTFLYICKSLYPEKKISAKQKFLFIPFIIGFLISLSYKILIAIDYKNDALYNAFSYIPSLIELIAIVLNQFIYVYLFIKIRRFEKENREFKFDKIQIKLNWLKKILLYLFVLTFIWMYLMYLVISNAKISFYPLWIGISLVTYWLGYIGIYKFGIIEERKNLKKYSKETKATYSIVEKQKNNHIVAFEHLIIDQKRFLDSDLTLDKIAEELGLSKSYLSRVINAELGVGFIDYVNSLRVEEAKNYLLNPEFSNYTLVAIGIEAGFNSKSTFYSSFKKITGQTPTEFKKDTANLS
jgi:AraC-like DNA-binding protein